MTSRNNSRNDMVTNSQTNKPSPRDIDNACRRLARVPNKKLNTNNRNINESPDNFASNFFAQNPDTPLDKRSPQEKLDEINAKLHDLDLEENDRFSLLVQKKAICSLAFGDSSPESFEALVQLGSFYNSQQRPDSALRHLLKAQEIIKTIDHTEDQKFSVAIEISDAYLSIRPQSVAEQNRNLNNAENVLRPYDESESEDKTLEYRKLLIQARIKFLRKQYDDSYNLYRKSYEVLDSANQGKTTEQVASLFHEMGECAEKGDDPKTALDMYQRAYDTFCELGMNDSAKMMKPKISKMTKLQAKLNDLEEEEEYNQYSRASSSRSNSRTKSKI